MIMLDKMKEYWWAIALVVTFIGEPVCGLFLPEGINQKFALWLKFLVALFSIILFYFLSKLATKWYKEKHDYDYKIFFMERDIENTKFYKTFSIMVCNCATAEKKVKLWTDQSIIDSCTEFVSTSTSIMSRPIYKRSKSFGENKYIIQCLFVPIDKNNRTLQIMRKSSNHGSLFYDKLKKRSSFISFSPVADHYQESFNPKKAYHREVFNNKAYDIKITSLGIGMRMTAENHYLFLIYTAHYDIEFNKDTIEDIFGTRFEDSKRKLKSYFQKDNDKIIGSVDFQTLLADEKLMDVEKLIATYMVETTENKLDY